MLHCFCLCLKDGDVHVFSLHSASLHEENYQMNGLQKEITVLVSARITFFFEKVLLLAQ